MVTTTFNQLKVGGGGYMRHIDIAPDGQMLCNSDVAGCWLYNSSTGIWADLLNQNRGFTVANPGNYAAYGMASAPSNTAIIYMYVNDGYVYRSVNRGATFVKLTNFAQIVSSTNAGTERFYGPRMAIDPINPDVFYICTAGSGVWVCTNGTSGSGSTPTFAQVAGITAAYDPGGYLVCFDKDGGSTAGSTNIAYIFSNTGGPYRRTTPGGAFSAITTGTSVPGGAAHMVVAGTTSVLYVADLTNNLHVFSGGTWSVISNTGISNIFDVTVDPASSGTRLVVSNINAQMSVSTNSGSSWTVLTQNTTDLSPQIPWLAQTGNSANRVIGNIAFDPSVSNTLMMLDGIGVWKCASFPNSGTYQFTSQTQGIENLVANGIASSPNASGTATAWCWDRSTIYTPIPSTYSAVQGPYLTYVPAPQEITMVWGLDWASSDKLTLVSLGYWQSGDFGFSSSNNGATWTPNPPSSVTVMSCTTSAGTAAGSNLLTFTNPSAFPWPTAYLMTVSNVTNPASIPAGTYLIGNVGGGPTNLVLSQNVAAPGVSSGDTINLKYSVTPYQTVLRTNASTASGAVLHFISVPSSVIVGMFCFNLTNGGSIVGGGSPAAVLSISGGDVTLNQAVLSTVNSGDVIFFYWGPGGSIACASPTNWVACVGQDSSFPMVTADGGATWGIIDIAGAPRIGTGTVTSGSTDVTNLSYNTSNVPVGMQVNNSYNYLAGATVSSILSANSFRTNVTASGGKSPDLILPVTGWGHANFNNIKNIAADRVTANTFYMYNYVTGKVYTSTSSGANGTWSIANSSSNLRTTYGMDGSFSMAMKSVPFLGGTNTAGHLFMTNSNIGPSPTGAFIRSTDGGVTWTAVSNIVGVGGFGFGAAKPGNSYPAIYAWGVVGGIQGTYRSDDNCTSWIQLGIDSYPMGTVQGVNDMDGDKNTYGTVYMALGANGWGFGALDAVVNTPAFGFSVITDSGQRRTKMIGY